MKQYKSILEISMGNRHSCAKLKTYHFSGEENNKFPDFIVENNADRSIELGDIYKELFLETLQGAML